MPEDMVAEKLGRKPTQQFVRAALAGAYIALGAELMLMGTAQGMPPIVCGAAFSVGLWMTMCAKGELFTENCLMLADYQPWKRGQAMRKCGIGAKNRAICRCLCITYVGNVIGAIVIAAVAALMALTAQDMSSAYEVALATCYMPPVITLARAVLCGVCVAIVIGLGYRTKSCCERLVYTMLPVTCFITCGWEHSITDMFLLVVAAPAISPDVALFTLAVTTVGNLMGAYGVGKLWHMAEKGSAK